MVELSWRAILEPLYEAALLTTLKRIQNVIPAHDLANQWDMAPKFAFLEGALSSPLWFSPAKEGLPNLCFPFMPLALHLEESLTLRSTVVKNSYTGSYSRRSS